ncbi:MAG: 6-bladed beta-propeller [Magnetococcales bacterium]|nr:6-bladed beta-propeller [Magnetococcales bacterium]
MTRLRKVALASLLLLLPVILLACVATKHEMTLGTERMDASQRLVWPSLPQTPRYEFIGEILGADNFRLSGDDSFRSAKGAMRWLVGLDPDSGFPKDLNHNLARPVSGVVDRKGIMYVTDMGQKAVFVFDPFKGEMSIWRKATANSHFSAPAGIAASANGDVFVADSALGFVARLNSHGLPIAEIGRDQLKRPVGVAWDPGRERLYVSDAWDDNIKIFDHAGKLVKVITGQTEESQLFNAPTHLTFAHNRLYVSDTLNAQVQVLDFDGGFLFTVGQRGNFMGNLSRPKGVAVDAEGNIYIVESFFDHLLVFNKNGRFLLPIGGTGTGKGQFYLPSGVWTDAAGRVFVADMFNGRVVVFQFLGGDD